MAIIGASQVVLVWTDNAADRAALYRVSKVTAGDTVDLGPSGATTEFQLVKQATFLATTIAGTAVCTVSGTVVTMPAGLALDAGYMLVWGDSN
jgi:hypothetical protein